MTILSKLLFGTVTAAFAATAAIADGVYKMYDYREGYIDEFEIVGDVTGPDGNQYAMFEMRDMKMVFYIPPEAAYVTISHDNPIIANNIPYSGYWVSTAAPGEAQWDSCNNGSVPDHNGVPRPLWGDLVHVYTELSADTYDLYFKLQIGSCGAIPEDWAFNDPSRELPSLDVAMETCGNEHDTTLRALGCSDVISNPLAPVADVSWALWSRAYVRCGDVPVSDTIADLTEAVRIHPSDWHDYYKRVSGYDGPMDGTLNYQLYGAISRWANKGCR